MAVAGIFGLSKEETKNRTGESGTVFTIWQNQFLLRFELEIFQKFRGEIPFFEILVFE